MKKLKLVTLMLLLITPASFAAEIESSATWVIAPTITSIENSIEVISNQEEETIYNYYYAPTCRWCQRLDNFLDFHNAFDTLNINKINVTWARGIEMVEAAEEHGIDGSSVGTPFVTYGPNGTGSAIETGFYGALELFAWALGVDAVEPTYETNSSQRLIIIILGLLIIIGPLAYLGLKK